MSLFFFINIETTIDRKSHKSFMHNGVGPTKVISIDTGPGRPRFTALQWPRQADPVVRGLARTRKNWLWFPSDFTRYLKQHPIHVLILAVQCSLQGHTGPARGVDHQTPGHIPVHSVVVAADDSGRPGARPYSMDSWTCGQPQSLCLPTPAGGSGGGLQEVQENYKRDKSV